MKDMLIFYLKWSRNLMCRTGISKLLLDFLAWSLWSRSSQFAHHIRRFGSDHSQWYNWFFFSFSICTKWPHRLLWRRANAAAAFCVSFCAFLRINRIENIYAAPQSEPTLDQCELAGRRDKQGMVVSTSNREKSRENCKYKDSTEQVLRYMSMEV